jgi:hypothetical protein
MWSLKKGASTDGIAKNDLALAMCPEGICEEVDIKWKSKD